MDSSRPARLAAAGLSAIVARFAGRVHLNLGVTAGGASLAASTALTGDYNASSSGSSGVKLPLWETGSALLYYNGSGGNNSVYPDTSTVTINAGSAGAAVTVANATLYLFIRTTATNWNAHQLT